MEYFIYLALFVGGWVLSKVDTKARITSIVGKQMTEDYEKVFFAGAKEGHRLANQQIEQQLRQAAIDHGFDPDTGKPTGTKETSEPMGFAIPNTNKGMN